MTANHAGCERNDRNARDLRNIGNGTRGARVHLNHIDFLALRDELNVDHALYVQRTRELFGVVDNLLLHGLGERLRRVDRNRVTGVNAGALNVLHDTRNQDILAVADRIDLNLNALNILVDQNRVFLRIAVDHTDVLVDIVVRNCDAHACAAEHVGGAHQHRIPEAVGNLLCLFRRKDRAARRARNARFLENRVKALSVLGRIDILRRRAENRNAHLHECFGQLDCGLTAELHDRAVRLLKVHNRFDILRGQRLKVELVRNVKVGRDRLRIVVDDDGLIALFPEGKGAVHGAEVELDALADAYRAGAENQNLLLRLCLLRLVLAVVDAVVVRGLRRKLRSAGIDHLKARVNLEFRALCLDLGLGLAAERRNHVIRELKALRIAEQLLGQRSSAELCLHADQTVQLMDEPAINLGQREDIVVGEAAAQCLRDDPDAAIVDHAQLSLELIVVKGSVVIAHQAVHVLLERTYRLHERALKVRADCHDLTGRLHLRAERVLCRDELIERKTRHLDHAVVEHGLEGSVGLLGHRVLDLIQGVAERNLRRDLCDRIAGRLRSERRGTADTRIHLNDAVLKAVRIQRVLHVAAAGNAELGDDVERGAAEHLVLLVAEGLRGRNHNRIARVHADRI